MEVRPQLLEQDHNVRLTTPGQFSAQVIAEVSVEKAISWYGATLQLIGRCLRQEDILQNHAQHSNLTNYTQ